MALDAGLGGTGLGGHRDGVILEGAVTGAAALLRATLHAHHHRLIGFVGHVHLVHDLHGVLIDHALVVLRHDPVQEGGLITGTLIHQRTDIVADLHGGEPVLRLTDGGEDLVALVPPGVIALVQGRLALGVGPVADGLIQLDACGLAQTQRLGGVVDVLDAHPVAQLVIEVVAGDLQGLGGFDGAVGPATAGVDQTFGAHAGVLGESALVLDIGPAADGTGFDARHGHGHLISGARRVDRLQGPVEHGLEVRLVQGFEVLEDGGQVIGRVASADQHLTGLDVHGHHRRALRVPTLSGAFFAPEPLDGQLQGLLGGGLELQIDGDLHVLACLRLYLIIRFDQGAVLGHLIHTGAVDAVEIFLEGLLQTGLAHQRVHGVAVQRLVMLPLLGVHGTHIAKDVGGVFRGVLPDGGGLHPHAGDVQLQHRRQRLVVHVGQEHISAQAVDGEPKGQLVSQAQHRPGIPVGPFRRDVVALPELLHQQRGGDVGIQIVPVDQEGLEIVLPALVLLIQRIGEGLIQGQGQVVHILDAPCLTQLHQLIEGTVGVDGAGEHIVVDRQVVAGPVGHQHVAVPVQNIAPGSLHPGQGGEGGDIVLVAAGVHHLHLVEPGSVETQHRKEDAQQEPGTEAGHSLHVSPPILPMEMRMG